MRLKILFVAIAVAVIVVPSALALRFLDESFQTPEGIVGTPYSHTLKGQSGCPPYHFVVINGALPPGLSLGESTGQIAGTPTTPGSFSFWVALRDTASGTCTVSSAERQFTINIIPKLTIQPEAAPGGTTGAPYSFQMTAGASGTLTWSVQSGVLPPGLTLDAGTGVISGTPTTAGEYVFRILVKDPKRSDTKEYSVAIRDPLAMTQPTLPPAEVGVSFAAALTATGGSGTNTWTVAGGSLPPGLVLDSATGQIAGTPSLAGRFGFTISVSDNEGRTSGLGMVITVARKVSVVTRLLRPAKIGRAYRTRVVASGGVAPLRWTLVSGRLPSGVRLDRKTGALAGIPRKAGTFVFRVEVRDSLDVSAARTLRVKVNA